MSVNTTDRRPVRRRHVDLAEEFLDRQTPLSRIRNILHRYPALSPAIVLVIAVIVFGLLNERFFRANNLSLITQQVAVVGTLAIAQTLIILTAGIDLSVGAVMVLSLHGDGPDRRQQRTARRLWPCSPAWSSDSPPAP